MVPSTPMRLRTRTWCFRGLVLVHWLSLFALLAVVGLFITRAFLGALLAAMGFCALTVTFFLVDGWMSRSSES